MALRRNARLRREYLYKKSLEGKAKEEYERKERLRTAITGMYMDIEKTKFNISIMFMEEIIKYYNYE